MGMRSSVAACAWDRVSGPYGCLARQGKKKIKVKWPGATYETGAGFLKEEYQELDAPEVIVLLKRCVYLSGSCVIFRLVC